MANRTHPEIPAPIPGQLNPLIQESQTGLADTVAHACAVLDVLTRLHHVTHNEGPAPSKNFAWGRDLMLDTVLAALRYALDADDSGRLVSRDEVAAVAKLFEGHVDDPDALAYKVLGACVPQQ